MLSFSGCLHTCERDGERERDRERAEFGVQTNSRSADEAYEFSPFRRRLGRPRRGRRGAGLAGLEQLRKGSSWPTLEQHKRRTLEQRPS